MIKQYYEVAHTSSENRHFADAANNYLDSVDGRQDKDLAYEMAEANGLDVEEFALIPPGWS